MSSQNPYNITFPDWAKFRSLPWKYAGWITRHPAIGLDFDESVEKGKHSDHGEIREVDIYPEGAVCWYKDA